MEDNLNFLSDKKERCQKKYYSVIKDKNNVLITEDKEATNRKKKSFKKTSEQILDKGNKLNIVSIDNLNILSNNVIDLNKKSSNIDNDIINYLKDYHPSLIKINNYLKKRDKTSLIKQPTVKYRIPDNFDFSFNEIKTQKEKIRNFSFKNYNYKIFNKYKNLKDFDKNYLNNFKNENKYFIFKLLFSQIFTILNDFIQIIFAIASCIIYILLTIYDKNSMNHVESELVTLHENNNHEIIHHLHKLELIIMTFTIFDFSLHIFKEKKKLLEFFMKIMTIIDITVIATFLLSLFKIFNQNVSFLHIFQIFRMMRIFRVFRIFNDYNQKDVNTRKLNDPFYAFFKELIIMKTTLIIIVFLFASILFELESFFHNLFKFFETNESKKLEFFNLVYILLLYIFTIGFGDMYPNHYLSRIILIIFFFTFYLYLINEINKLFLIKKTFSNHLRKINFKEHFIITGFYNLKSLKIIIKELLALDKKIPIVLASQIELKSEIRNYINKKGLKNKVIIVYQEDAYNLFENACFSNSKLVFLLSNYENIKNIKVLDNKITFLCKNIYNYNKKINMKIQLYENKNKNNLKIHTQWSPLIEIFSHNYLKTSFMANSIFNKGIIPFLFNLFYIEDRNYNINSKEYDVNMIEYRYSFDQKIIFKELIDIMDGYSFKDLAFYFYNYEDNKTDIFPVGIILIGIKTFINNCRGEILINPINYKINKGDLGIFIYNNSNQIKISIEDFNPLNNNEEINKMLKDFDLESNNNSLKIFMDIKNPIVKNIKRISLQTYQNTYTINNLKKEIETYFNKQLSEKNNYYNKLNKNIKEYKMFESNLNGLISGHIIIFGPFEYLLNSINIIRQRSNKPICYFNNEEICKNFKKIQKKFINIYYFQGDYLDLNHLSNSSMKNCFYVIIYSEKNHNSIFNDSNTLMIVNTLTNHFPKIKLVYEIYDKKKIQFLDTKNNYNSKTNFLFWKDYTSGNVFFNSFIDKIMLSSLKNSHLCEIFSILYQDLEKEFYDEKFEDNKEIFIMDLPQILENYNFQHIFNFFISLKVSLIPVGLIINSNSKVYTPLVINNPSKSKIIKKGYKIILIGNYFYNENKYAKINENYKKVNTRENLDEEDDLLYLIKQKILKEKKIKNIYEKRINDIKLETSLYENFSKSKNSIN